MKIKKNIGLYSLIGGLIGFVIGWIISIDQYELLPDFFSDLSKPIRKLLGLFYNCSEVSCAIDYVLSIILTYALIGILVGIIIYYTKTKNENK